MATPSNKRSRDSESTEEPVVDEKSTSKQNNAAPEGEQTTCVEKFEELKLSQPTLKAIEKMGFTTMTSVQARTIHLFWPVGMFLVLPRQVLVKL